MLSLHPNACCEMGHYMLTLYPSLATKVKSEQCKLMEAACQFSLSLSLSLTQTDTCGSHRQRCVCIQHLSFTCGSWSWSGLDCIISALQFYVWGARTWYWSTGCCGSGLYRQLFISVLFKTLLLVRWSSEEVHETCKSSGHIVFAMQSYVHCRHKSKQCIQLRVQRQFTAQV